MTRKCSDRATGFTLVEVMVALAIAGLSLAAVALLLYRSVGDAKMLVIVLGGMIATAAALYLVGRGLVHAMGRFRAGDADD